jgi:hypothetical protein
MEENKDTSWTSIDLYYKGVHVKKSIAENIKTDALIKVIDTYLDAGFKPSWNEDTNKVALTPSETPQNAPQKATRPCSHEGCTGIQTLNSGISKKTGKPWKAWFCSVSEDHAEFTK